MSGLLDTLRPHTASALLHVGLVSIMLLLSPVIAGPDEEDVVEVDLVSMRQPTPPPPATNEPQPPKEDPEPPPPPPRPDKVPPKVAMKKVETAQAFHPKAEALKEKAQEEPEADSTPSYEVPQEPPRFELAMEATVSGGSGIEVVSVDQGPGRVLADPGRPGSPDSDGPVSPPTYVPEVEVADTWEISEEPEPLNDHKFEPHYPPAARAQGLEQTVVVRLWISKTGKVLQAKIVSSGGAQFDQSALAYCRKLRFRPAMANQDPVAARIDWTVEFKI